MAGSNSDPTLQGQAPDLEPAPTPSSDASAPDQGSPSPPLDGGQPDLAAPPHPQARTAEPGAALAAAAG